MVLKVPTFERTSECIVELFAGHLTHKIVDFAVILNPLVWLLVAYPIAS